MTEENPSSILKGDFSIGAIQLLGLSKILGDIEVCLIRVALRESATIAEAARALKLPRTTLFMKMKKYGIEARR